MNSTNFKLSHLKILLVSFSISISSASLAEEAISFMDQYGENISAILKQQTAYGTHSSSINQNEWQLDLEYSDAIDTGILSGDIMAIARARFDFQQALEDESGNSLRIRELYWQTYGDNSFWRIGKQQVVWGEADGIKLLDVINPQDFREFILDDFDDSRIPLWMMNAQINTSDSGILQLLVIPDTSTHTLAEDGSIYQLTSPVLVPTIDMEGLIDIGVNKISVDKKTKADGGDIGTRYSDFISLYDSSWDITLNYLYHYVDIPVIRTAVVNNELLIDYQFERSHLIGGSTSTVIADFILRSEIAYETDRYQRGEESNNNVINPIVIKSNTLSSIIGIDYQGISDHFISMQWYRQTLLLSKDKLQQAIADRDEDRVTLLWETKFLNETLTTRWQHLHGINHNDGVLRPKVIYNWQSNIDVYLGADYFYGKSEDFFGQFNNTDRIVAGFTIGI
jgi:hypothetical protein